MPTGAGQRDELITFERVSQIDDGYTEKDDAWAAIGEEFAEVRFGASSERRVAAQERAIVSATFGVLDNPLTRSVTTKDRIQFDGGAWDINSNVKARQPGHRELTAVRDT